MVEPTVHNVQMGCVLVDGGSSINLLFVDALDALQILMSELKPSPPFFGILLGSSAKPLWGIELPVTFGSPKNFRTVMILFDVVDFGTTYNAILSRPAMAQFMVVVHYTYQAMKILGPKGAITIVGNRKTILHCDKRSLDMVELALESQPENTGPSSRPEKVHVTTSSVDRLKEIEANPDKIRAIN
ncbi:uncharacterized protein LOC133884037 [Phragmites australis]|uniref:uncharacterized protein LOC133884037 n=1 Tax=Phragmites australis TaxID=29695 RepID=UPI002D7A0294|nr:uncharacterized protein LOC133884037 [Phragmites australis]